MIILIGLLHDSISGMRMTRACWLYFMGKFLEFADTFFFLARKKFEHVSYLQVIHHSIMPLYGYVMVRWLPGGHETFGGTLNSLVHIFMYGYYFLAALGKESTMILLNEFGLPFCFHMGFDWVFRRTLYIVLLQALQRTLVMCPYTMRFACSFAKRFVSATVTSKPSAVL